MASPRMAEILRTIGFGKPKFPTQDVDPDVMAIVLGDRVRQVGGNTVRASSRDVDGVVEFLRTKTIEDQLRWAQRAWGDDNIVDELLREAQRRTHRAYYGPDRGPEGM